MLSPHVTEYHQALGKGRSDDASVAEYLATKVTWGTSKRKPSKETVGQLSAVASALGKSPAAKRLIQAAELFGTI